MKKITLITAIIFGLILSGISQVNPNHHWVDTYVKKNGTVVQGHNRTNPNCTNRDNYSTWPNTNPWTGEKGTVIPDNKTCNNVYSSYYNAGSNNIDEIINNFNSNYNTNSSIDLNGFYESFEISHPSIDYDIFNNSHEFTIPSIDYDNFYNSYDYSTPTVNYENLYDSYDFSTPVIDLNNFNSTYDISTSLYEW